MASGESGGNRAGNLQLNANTGVTIGLVVTVFCAAGAAIYKASEVVTDLSYVKRDISETRLDVAEMKRIIQRLDRQQGAATAK